MMRLMKRVLYLVVFALFPALILMGCNSKEAQETTSASPENTQQINVSNTANHDRPQSSRTALEYRDAASDIERFAMEFMDKIYHMFSIHKHGWERLDELMSFVKPGSFYPIAPRSASDEDIGRMVLAYCVRASIRYGGVVRYGEIDHVNVFDYDIEGGAVGIVGTEPSEFVAGATSVEVAIWTGSSEIVTSAWVEVLRESDGFYIMPIISTSKPSQAERFKFDLPVVISVPSGFGIMRRGEKAVPKVVNHEGLDYYELEGVFRGVPEELVVDMGEPFGHMNWIVYGDGSITMSSSAGYSGYASSDIVTDLMALCVTHSDLRGVRDEIVQATGVYVQRIGELLTDNDYEGFVTLTPNPDVFRGSIWSSKFSMWAREDANASFATATREVSVNKIDVLSDGKARILFTTLLTLPSGSRYTADSQLLLIHSDDEWLIWNMTDELLKRDQRTWTRVE